MGFRDTLRIARERIHATYQVDALYIPTTGGTPLPVVVRVHNRFQPMQGVPDGAQRLDVEPRIVFSVSQVPKPRVNAVVSVEPGEAYRVAAADPPYLDFVTARVTPLTADEATGLPVP